MYDSNHKITRAGAEQAIREGGTVLIAGRLHGRVESLPSEAEFAVGDADATQRALDGLKAQRQALDEQERKLHEANARVEQSRKDAEARDKERAKAEAKNPPPPPPPVGRVLMPNENPDAERQANETAERNAEREQQAREQATRPQSQRRESEPRSTGGERGHARNDR